MTKNPLLPAFASALFALVLTPSAFAESCLVREGALDIGSGSTKVYAAVVDHCQKRIVETLYDEKVAISFSEALEKSDKGEIPSALIKEAAGRIAEHLKAMKEKNIDQVSGVATAAFRKAKNGAAAAAELSQLLNAPVKVLTQDEEAELGAASALSKITKAKGDSRQLIVWDIGGGSMQMWSKYKGKAQLFKGDLASVTFKNRVISEVQSGDPQKTASPNPLGAKADAATAVAKKHARENVPLFFKSKAPQARWVGIGGVLSTSLPRQIGDGSPVTRFSQKELAATLHKRAKFTDEEVGGDYRQTDVTNLALVLGYMKGLGIKRVEAVEATLTQGWLLTRERQVPQAQPATASAAAPAR